MANLGITMTTWTPVNIAKLAGLLEADGCFYQRKGGYPAPKRAYPSPEINISMTDQDTIEWIAGMFERPMWTRRREGRQPLFKTSVSSWRAISIMQTIYTFMGIRRRAKIRELIETWKQTPSRRPYRWPLRERARRAWPTLASR